MRDSRLGTHGGLALIFVLLAKVLVVSELALRGTSVLAALAAACAAGQGVAVLLMYRHRYAREEGLGNVFIGKVSGRQTCVTPGRSGNSGRHAATRHARRGGVGDRRGGHFCSWAIAETHSGRANRRHAGGGD